MIEPLQIFLLDEQRVVVGRHALVEECEDYTAIFPPRPWEMPARTDTFEETDHGDA